MDLTESQRRDVLNLSTLLNSGGEIMWVLLKPNLLVVIIRTTCRNMKQTYEGYSKINLRLVGKNKRFVIASKRTLSSNKELLFLL